MNREGKERLGVLTDAALFVAGTALYAGEGSKTDGEVRFSNSDPRMVRLFCTWFRHFFSVDETRMRGRLYLHQGLDLSAAEAFWSSLANIPTAQFHKPYARLQIRASVETSMNTVASPSATDVHARIAK